MLCATSTTTLLVIWLSSCLHLTFTLEDNLVINPEVNNALTVVPTQKSDSQWPHANESPPGVWREAAPITSNILAQLELTPDTHLYAQAGMAALVMFDLRNLDSRSRRFAISVQEHSGDSVIFPDSPPTTQASFQPRLSEQEPFLNPNETRVITVFLQIPSSTLGGTQKTYTLQVQPLGTTASGAPGVMVRRFHFEVMERHERDPYNSDLTAPQCATIERVVSETCLSVSQDPQKCGQHTWRGQLQIQVNTGFY